MTVEKVPRVMTEKTAEVIGCVESVVEYDVYIHSANIF